MDWKYVKKILVLIFFFCTAIVISSVAYMFGWRISTKDTTEELQNLIRDAQEIEYVKMTNSADYTSALIMRDAPAISGATLLSFRISPGEKSCLMESLTHSKLLGGRFFYRAEGLYDSVIKLKLSSGKEYKLWVSFKRHSIAMSNGPDRALPGRFEDFLTKMEIANSGTVPATTKK